MHVGGPQCSTTVRVINLQIFNVVCLHANTVGFSKTEASEQFYERKCRAVPLPIFSQARFRDGVDPLNLRLDFGLISAGPENPEVFIHFWQSNTHR